MRFSKSSVKVLKLVYRYWSEDRVSSMAAALAYYTIFSMIPFLVICIHLAGYIVGLDYANQQIVNQLSTIVGPETTKPLALMIKNVTWQNKNFLSTLFTVVFLLIGAAGVFTELQGGLNVIWKFKTTKKGSTQLIKHYVLPFVLMFAISLIITGSLLVNVGLNFLNTKVITILSITFVIFVVINYLITLILTAFLFAIIYKVLPDAFVDWRHIWLGAILSAVLFSLGKFLLEFYLSVIKLNSLFGAASSLIVILIWVYYSSQIFFLGAEFVKATQDVFKRKS